MCWDIFSGSDWCFYGKCMYCRSKEDGVCGDGSKLEGALVLWLPEGAEFKKFRNPWQRIYNMSSNRKARFHRRITSKY